MLEQVISFYLDERDQKSEPLLNQGPNRDSFFVQTADIHINNTIDIGDTDPSKYTNWSGRPSHPPKYRTGQSSFGPEDLWGGGDFKNLPNERSGTRVVSGIIVPASLEDDLPFRAGTEKPTKRDSEADPHQISASLKF